MDFIMRVPGNLRLVGRARGKDYEIGLYKPGQDHWLDHKIIPSKQYPNLLEAMKAYKD